MCNLEDPKDEWEVEEVQDKRKFKDVVHYLVKWAGWPSEYNLYEPTTHLANAPKAIATFEQKLKWKKAQEKDYEEEGPNKWAHCTA